MMLVNSPAAVQLMIALLEVGPSGATREHLVTKADIGTTTFYRVMRPLLERGVITQDGSRYYLPLSQWYNYRFKLWHDAERLFQLESKDRSDVLDILHHARESLGAALSCLWLVGSAAHQQLGATSDLDFLAVVKESDLYHPEATRPVNFVTVTEAEFRARYEQRDGFVLSALQYGILLFDRDFSQPFYSRATPVEPGDRKMLDAERALERQRKRLLEQLDDDEIDLARETLERFCGSLARLMLQALGELPAGKRDLLESANIYFGPRFHTWLHASTSKMNKTAILASVRQGSEYKDRFFKNCSHLKAFAQLPYARSAELERLCAAVLTEILPKASVQEKVRTGASTLDLVAHTRSKATYVFEVKSLEREVDKSVLTELRAKSTAYSDAHPGEAVSCVLITNSFRTVPVRERPPSGAQSPGNRAHDFDVHVISAIDMLRAHNYLHIEGVTPAQAAELLNLRPRRRETPAPKSPTSSRQARSPSKPRKMRGGIGGHGAS